MSQGQEFRDRALDYARYRPLYPEAAIAYILAGLDNPIIADIGAGTGISSRLLAQWGAKVFAIEPNAEMREAARAHPQVKFLDNTAENTGLDDASVDLVTCFQSFHWFNKIKSLQEFHRILKPAGRLAFIWNFWDWKHDECTKAFAHVVIESAFSHPLMRLLTEIKDTKIAYFFYYWQFSLLLRWCRFTHICYSPFSYTQTLDLSGAVGLAMSQSTVPRSGCARQEIADKLANVCNKFSDERGKIRLLYRTQVYLARAHP